MLQIMNLHHTVVAGSLCGGIFSERIVDERTHRFERVCRSGALGESAWLAVEVGETMPAAEVAIRE